MLDIPADKSKNKLGIMNEENDFETDLVSLMSTESKEEFYKELKIRN